MQRYVFRDPTPLGFANAAKADPNKVGRAIEKVAAANNGRLNVDDVIEAARDPKNALHQHITWDNAAAADKWRRQEARAIIRAIKVVEAEDEEPVRRFLSVRDDDGHLSYRTRSDIMASSDLQRRILIQAEKELNEFSTRYRELKDVCALVDAARERVREELNAGAPA